MTKSECRNCGKEIARSKLGRFWFHKHSGAERCDGITKAEPKESQ
jgi:ssDNA-binding Zn-finger/Zn-ribbon topoisomerase 1